MPREPLVLLVLNPAGRARVVRGGPTGSGGPRAVVVALLVEMADQRADE
jgi:hypothetical protein